jgi:hypothetical protein
MSKKKASMTVTLDHKTAASIGRIIDYLNDSEQSHWEENDCPKSGHIFCDVQVVDKWFCKNGL